MIKAQGEDQAEVEDEEAEQEEAITDIMVEALMNPQVEVVRTNIHSSSNPKRRDSRTQTWRK